MEMVAVVLGAVATVAVVMWFLLPVQHPDDASGHEPTDRSISAALHGDVSDRPAGPGAEADGVVDRGQPAPGPSGDSVEAAEPPAERHRGGVEE